jgi:hypothetical protein
VNEAFEYGLKKIIQSLLREQNRRDGANSEVLV